MPHRKAQRRVPFKPSYIRLRARGEQNVDGLWLCPKECHQQWRIAPGSVDTSSIPQQEDQRLDRSTILELLDRFVQGRPLRQSRFQNVEVAATGDERRETVEIVRLDGIEDGGSAAHSAA